MASAGRSARSPQIGRPPRASGAIGAATRAAVVLALLGVGVVGVLPGCGGIGLDAESTSAPRAATPDYKSPNGDLDAAPAPGFGPDSAADGVASPNAGSSPLCNWMGTGTGCKPDDTSCIVPAVDAGAPPPAPSDGGASAADGGTPVVDAGHTPEAAPAVLGCHVVKKANSSMVGPTCSISGNGTDTSPCLNGASCAAGFECVGASGQCRHYCCESSACDDSRFCDIQPIFGSRDVLKVPVCMPITACKLFSACDKTNETCAVVNEGTGQTSCVAVGPRNVTEECETEHCGMNLTCLGSAGSRKCHKLCHVDRDNECGKGEECRGNSMTFKDGVGVCSKLLP